HLDPGLAQQSVGIGISIVGDDHARLESDDIVAVVPLFAFGLPGVAAGLLDPQCLEPEGILHDVDQRFVVRAHVDAAGGGARIDAIAADLIDDLAKHRTGIAVAEAEHGVEVHRRPALRHDAGYDPLGRIARKELMNQLPNRLMPGAFAHAAQHNSVADRHDVAAFD